MTLPDAAPPLTPETARGKVRLVEDAWNSRDPERIVQFYTRDSKWRNRVELIEGHEQIKAFLQRKWAKEQGYRLRMELWCSSADRIAVIFRYEWHDAANQWVRSYGNELWEFASSGLITRRVAAINDKSIAEDDRQLL